MKTVVVIGGSKGIGQAIVQEQLLHHRVFSISRTLSMLEHENLEQYTCDVVSEDLPALEAVDALVYCPGTINLKPFRNLSTSDFIDDFNINVLGAIRTIQHYLPQLSTSKWNPSILFFSTVAVKLGMPFHSSISSAKGAVEGLTRSLAAELAPLVRVNCVAPTLTETSLSARILRNEKLKEVHAERHPLKKYLLPNEVAAMAGFLLSEKALSFSGQIFEMDCGLINLKT